MWEVIYWALVVGGSVAAVYAVAYIVSGAFFDRKMEYNRRLLQQLEEKHDAKEDK